MSDEILTTAEAAALLGVSRSTLKRWRSDGHGPQWSRLTDAGNGMVRYTRKAIDQWLDERNAAEAAEDARREGE